MMHTQDCKESPDYARSIAFTKDVREDQSLGTTIGKHPVLRGAPSLNIADVDVSDTELTRWYVAQPCCHVAQPHSQSSLPHVLFVRPPHAMLLE